jgi:hypothetical protein
MIQPHDDESADEKFKRFQEAMEKVLAAPKPPPSGSGENSNEPEDAPS